MWCIYTRIAASLILIFAEWVKSKCIKTANLHRQLLTIGCRLGVKTKPYMNWSAQLSSRLFSTHFLLRSIHLSQISLQQELSSADMIIWVAVVRFHALSNLIQCKWDFSSEKKPKTLPVTTFVNLCIYLLSFRLNLLLNHLLHVRDRLYFNFPDFLKHYIRLRCWFHWICNAK